MTKYYEDGLDSMDAIIQNLDEVQEASHAHSNCGEMYWNRYYIINIKFPNVHVNATNTNDFLYLWPPVKSAELKQLQIDSFLSQTIRETEFWRIFPTPDDIDGKKYAEGQLSFVRSISRFAQTSQRAYQKSWNHFALAAALLIVQCSKLCNFTEALFLYVEAMHDIEVPSSMKDIMTRKSLKGNTLVSIVFMIGHYKHTRGARLCCVRRNIAIFC